MAKRNPRKSYPISDMAKDKIGKMYLDKFNVTDIAKAVGIKYDTVYKYITRHKNDFYESHDNKAVAKVQTKEIASNLVNRLREATESLAEEIANDEHQQRPLDKAKTIKLLMEIEKDFKSYDNRGTDVATNKFIRVFAELRETINEV